MTGNGTVIRTNGDVATVSVRKTSACSHDCSECSTCTAPVFETDVFNPIGAKPEDRVLIEADTKKILLLSVLVYMLPVMLFICAAVACEALAVNGGVTALVFVCMIAIWILVIRVANKKIRTQNTIVSVDNETVSKAG